MQHRGPVRTALQPFSGLLWFVDTPYDAGPFGTLDASLCFTRCWTNQPQGMAMLDEITSSARK